MNSFVKHSVWLRLFIIFRTVSKHDAYGMGCKKVSEEIFNWLSFQALPHGAATKMMSLYTALLADCTLYDYIIDDLRPSSNLVHGDCP